MKYTVKLKKSEGIVWENERPYFIINLSILTNKEDSYKDHQVRIFKYLLGNDFHYDENADYRKFDGDIKKLTNFSEEKYMNFWKQMNMIVIQIVTNILTANPKCHDNFYLNV